MNWAKTRIYDRITYPDLKIGANHNPQENRIILEFIIKKKKYRGHYCWVCRNILPNEKFSGKGHSRHICRKCSKLSKEKLDKISDDNFIYNISAQKNISIKNINRLETISKKYPGVLGEQATIIMKVAQVHPARKKRLGFLYHKHRELFDELVGRSRYRGEKNIAHYSLTSSSK